MKLFTIIFALFALPALAQNTSVPTAQITTAISDASALATQASAISSTANSANANAVSIAKKAGNKTVIQLADTVASQTAMINTQAATINSQANALSGMMLAWTHGGGGTGSSAPSPGPSASLFAAPYYTCSTNKYVSTTGSDSANGSLATPWLTLAHADSTTPTAGTCINVEPGTYAAGLQVNHGGNFASSTGYVVYRCTTLDGCTITDDGQNGGSFSGHAAIFVAANYVQFDGFILSSSPALQNNTAGFLSCEDCTGSTYVAGFHHIWILNSIVIGYGVSGITAGDFEYLYIIHDTTHGDSANASCNGGAQGSGISLNTPVPVSGYTPTADDANNSVTGNTGTKFRNFVMWSVTYNNHVAGCSPATDGNGFTTDTLGWNCNQGNTSCTSGAAPYVNGVLVDHNIAYNNGGSGFHIFASEYVTVSNNSCYNNYLDTTIGANPASCFDDNLSYGVNFINNTAYVPCNGTGNILDQVAVGLDGVENGSTGNGFATTLGAAITTTGQTSITIASAANMPGGSNSWSSNGWYGNGDYSLPGGNMIQIGSELMQVTAGWGTTTLTVTRGFAGTTAATHTNGTAVAWVPSYWTNNVINAAVACTNGDGHTITNNYEVWLTTNKSGTSPGWVNVGNSSTGTYNAQPNGVNFALSGGSAAIGYGLTETWLPSQSVDAGACSSSLSTCP